jgi:hypothetical protein
MSKFRLQKAKLESYEVELKESCYNNQLELVVNDDRPYVLARLTEKELYVNVAELEHYGIKVKLSKVSE